MNLLFILIRHQTCILRVVNVYSCLRAYTCSYSKPAEEPEEPGTNNDDSSEDAASTADVKDPKEYEQVFKPNNKLGKGLAIVV